MAITKTSVSHTISKQAIEVGRKLAHREGRSFSGEIQWLIYKEADEKGIKYDKED